MPFLGHLGAGSPGPWQYKEMKKKKNYFSRIQTSKSLLLLLTFWGLYEQVQCKFLIYPFFISLRSYIFLCKTRLIITPQVTMNLIEPCSSCVGKCSEIYIIQMITNLMAMLPWYIQRILAYIYLLFMYNSTREAWNHHPELPSNVVGESVSGTWWGLNEYLLNEKINMRFFFPITCLYQLHEILKFSLVKIIP